jgi:hypothetical protein
VKPQVTNIFSLGPWNYGFYTFMSNSGDITFIVSGIVDPRRVGLQCLFSLT